MDRELAKAGILVIAASPDIVTTIPLALVVEPFQVFQARTGWAGLRLLDQHHPDLVLLGTSLPDATGWDTCARIRRDSDVPIMLIGGPSTEDEVVRAFDAGADDYVAAPCRAREVLARIRAILRRQRRSILTGSGHRPLVYDGGRLVIDLDRHEVQVAGHGVALTATEFRLLIYLAINRGRLLTHRQILGQVWGPGYLDQADYVKVYIRTLRGKIEACARQPRYIISRRGLGYMFTAEPADSSDPPSALPQHPSHSSANGRRG